MDFESDLEYARPFSALPSLQHLTAKFERVRIAEADLPSVPKIMLSSAVDDLGRIAEELDAFESVPTNSAKVEKLKEMVHVEISLYETFISDTIEDTLNLERILDEYPTPSARPHFLSQDSVLGKSFSSLDSSSKLARLRSVSRNESPAFSSATMAYGPPTSSIFNDSYTEKTSKISDVTPFQWTELASVSAHLFSEVSRNSVGIPVMIYVKKSVFVGTSRGFVLVYDFAQDFLFSLGFENTVLEHGSITSISVSSDDGFLAAAHSKGSIVVWDLKRRASIQSIVPVKGVSSPVTSICFSDSAKNIFVSCDALGNLFHHTIRSNILSFFVDTARISYTDKKSDLDKRSCILEICPVPQSFGNSLFKRAFVAVLTSTEFLVVRIQPLVRIEVRIGRRTESDGIGPGCNAAFPSANPIFAYSWAGELFVGQLRHTGATPDKEKLVYEELFALQCFSGNILALNFLSSEYLSVVTDKEDLQIVSVMTGAVIETESLKRFHVRLQDVAGPSGAPYYSSMSQTAISYKGKYFVLGTASVSYGSLIKWRERLEHISAIFGLVDVIALSLDVLESRTDFLCLGLPQDPQARSAMLSEFIAEKCMHYLQLEMEATVYDGDSSSLQRSMFVEKASFAVESLLRLGRASSISQEVYALFEAKSELLPWFLDVLVEFILDGRLKQVVSPTLLQRLVEHLQSADRQGVFESCLINLDPFSMNLDAVIRICQKHGFNDAFTYIYMSLSNYVAPLVNFLEMLEKWLVSSSSGETTAAVSKDLVCRVFVFLQFVFCDKLYPNGNDLHEHAKPLAKTASLELVKFLFSRTLQKSSGKLICSHAGSYPYLNMLLLLDAREFLLVLSSALQHAELFEAGSEIDRTFVVRTLLEIASLESTPRRISGFIYGFVAKSCAQYHDSIATTIDAKSVLIAMLALDSSEKSLRFEVEHGVAVLVPHLQLTAADEDQILQAAQDAGFYKLAARLFWKRRQYHQVLSSLLKTPTLQDEAFAFVRCLMLHETSLPPQLNECLVDGVTITGIKLSVREAEDLRKAVLENAVTFVELNPGATVEMISESFPLDHRTVIYRLAAHPLAHYSYLKVLFLASNSGTFDLAELRKDRPLRESFLELMASQEPDKVASFVHFLSSTDSGGESAILYERVLQICQEHELFEATIFVLEKLGRISSALDTIVDNCRGAFEGVFSVLQYHHSLGRSEFPAEARHKVRAGNLKLAGNVRLANEIFLRSVRDESTEHHFYRLADLFLDFQRKVSSVAASSNDPSLSVVAVSSERRFAVQTIFAFRTHLKNVLLPIMEHSPSVSAFLSKILTYGVGERRTLEEVRDVVTSILEVRSEQSAGVRTAMNISRLDVSELLHLLNSKRRGPAQPCADDNLSCGICESPFVLCGGVGKVFYDRGDLCKAPETVPVLIQGDLVETHWTSINEGPFVTLFGCGHLFHGGCLLRFGMLSYCPRCHSASHSPKGKGRDLSLQMLGAEDFLGKILEVSYNLFAFNASHILPS